MNEREIVLDTETTGLEAAEHSIIEIGCVEILDRRLTGRSYHQYINPGRSIDEGAIAVHGITMDMLRDKPRFDGVANELLAFIGDARLVIHNAEFDMGFLEVEFRRCGRAADWPPPGEVIDSLKLARTKHPNQRNSLDALCKRYEVDNSGRELHGALLDAQLLADVYLALTGGQSSLSLKTAAEAAGPGRSIAEVIAAAGREPRRMQLSAEQEALHRGYLELLQKAAGQCLWLESEASDDDARAPQAASA